MDMLSQDLRRAGYWGGNADISEIGGTLPLLTENGNCLGSGNNDWARMLDKKVFGLNDNRTNYDCLPNTTLPSQDVLVVRR